MGSPWKRIIKLCDERLRKLRGVSKSLTVHNQPSDATMTSDTSNSANLLFDQMKGAQWTGAKKQKREVSANVLVIPEKKLKEDMRMSLVFAPVLFKGFKFQPTIQPHQMSRATLKAAQKNMAFQIKAAEESNTAPDVLDRMRKYAKKVDDQLTFKSDIDAAVEEFLVNRVWEYGDNGEVLYKGFPKATPELSPQGRAPAQSKASGVNAKTGKKTYTTPQAKTGGKSPAPSADDEKPAKHTADMLAATVGLKLPELQKLAAKASGKKFTALIRKKYLSKVQAAGFTDTDLDDIQRDLTTQ